MPTTHRKLDAAGLSRQQLAHWPQFAIDMRDPFPAAAGLWNTQLPGVLTAMGQEWGDFVMRRPKEDAELTLQLAQSRSPAEFWDRCAGFWSKLAANYRRQWETLARLGNERTQHGEGNGNGAGN